MEIVLERLVEGWFVAGILNLDYLFENLCDSLVGCTLSDYLSHLRCHHALCSHLGWSRHCGR